MYEIASSDLESVEASLFHAGVQAAEWAHPLATRPQGALVCESVVILGDSEGVDHRELMAWSHWALKNQYGPVGVTAGKLRESEERLTEVVARPSLPRVRSSRFELP